MPAFENDGCYTPTLRDRIAEAHYFAMYWLEAKGVPLLLTANIEDVLSARDALDYKIKNHGSNSLSRFLVALEMCGGLRGYYRSLTAEIDPKRFAWQVWFD
jgi:hypothetical protein